MDLTLRKNAALKSIFSGLTTIAFLLMLALAGCSSGGTQDASSLKTVSTDHVSIEVPADWVEGSDMSGGAILGMDAATAESVNPPDSKYPSIIVADLAQKAPLANLESVLETSLKTEIENISIDENPALALALTSNGQTIVGYVLSDGTDAVGAVLIIAEEGSQPTEEVQRIIESIVVNE